MGLSRHGSSIAVTVARRACATNRSPYWNMDFWSARNGLFLPLIIYIFIAIAWVALMALHDVILPWIYREGKYAPPPIEIASALRPTHLPG
jgi:hypothetical protein